MSTPTDRWLAQVPAMEPLGGELGTAERLLLLLHYGIDWENSWVAGYLPSYWSRLLPDRVFLSTFRSRGKLRGWWQEVSQTLDSGPRSSDERRELEILLRAEPLLVLEVLRRETQPLVLRTQITAEAVRGSRPKVSRGEAEAP